MRELIVQFLQIIFFILLIPFFIWSRLPLPEQDAFTAPSQGLALIPGSIGILLRRVWYRFTLKHCGCKLTVDWLAVIRTRKAEIGNSCTFGNGSWIGWVKTGDNVITGNNITVLSGNKQHDYSDTSSPIVNQKGAMRQVALGNDLWIGAQAIIMTDVAPGTVIGAGSIVTKIFPENSVIVGNPARVLRSR